MRIARIGIEGGPRTAVVSADGESARPFAPDVSVFDLLAAEPEECERIAGTAVAEVGLSDARLLAPVQPATVRDFSVFEQHTEGVRLYRDPHATVPDIWYESPFCYFSNPTPSMVRAPRSRFHRDASTSISNSRWRP